MYESKRLRLSKGVCTNQAVSKREAAYINALTRRYSDNASATRAELDKNYAEAMAGLVRSYPEDLDALTLYGAALMNFSLGLLARGHEPKT